jgi:hypothetical protein
MEAALFGRLLIPEPGVCVPCNKEDAQNLRGG